MTEFTQNGMYTAQTLWQPSTLTERVLHDHVFAESHLF